MRIVRFGEKGTERIGLLDRNGGIRDATAAAAAADPSDVAAILRALEGVQPQALPSVDTNVRLGCPIPHVGKIICVGLNYSDHAAESGMKVPEEPVLFMKANTSVSGPNDDILIPIGANKVDWEIELGVIIGKRGTRLAMKDVQDHIAGYTIVHDVSERAWQLERSGQWLKGKSLDTFCPVGPYLVTRDEVPDPQALRMFLDVNGTRMQNGSTATMVFHVAHLVSYISEFMTLEPGDLISTGTPPGVGMGRRPPLYLRDGDVVELSIEGLGIQRQRVRRLTA